MKVQALGAAASGSATQTWLVLVSWALRFGVGECVLGALASCGTPEISSGFKAVWEVGSE